jgi:hypothetical protein
MRQAKNDAETDHTPQGLHEKHQQARRCLAELWGCARVFRAAFDIGAVDV